MTGKTKVICGYVVPQEIADMTIVVGKLAAKNFIEELKSLGLNAAMAGAADTIENAIYGEIKTALLRELYGGQLKTVERDRDFYKEASLCPVCRGESGNPKQVCPPSSASCVCGGLGTAQAAYGGIAEDYAKVCFELRRLKGEQP